jgi:folate-binding protein YgfZ
MRSTLDAWHRQRGGVLASWNGIQLPADYGAVAAELRAVAEGCAAFDLTAYEVVDLLGPDRLRFLNGLVTVAVKDLEPGKGVYGLVTEVRGHLIADVLVSARADRLRLMVPRGRGSVVAQHLQRYIVADRVSLEATTPITLVWLGGAHLEGCLAAGGTSLPEAPFVTISLVIGGREVVCVTDPRLGVPAVVAELPEGEAAELLGLLVRERGVVPLGWRGWDCLRIRAGLPVWGADFGPDCLPQETSLRGVVDFEKGCYLGQEVIARLHYRGQAPRLVRRLRGAEFPFSVGAEVRFEGRPAGRIGSVDTVSLRPTFAFGMLQRRAAEPGTLVEVDGFPVVVEEL